MKHLIATTALVSFVLFACAAWAYPGGNHFDHHAVGHDFWRNALCDVARTRAVGGAPNALGSVLARLAMTTIAIGIGATLWSLPRRFAEQRRLGLAVRVLAVITVPAAIAVVLLPTDRFSALHGIVVMLAGIPGTLAAGGAVVGLVRAPDAPPAVTYLGLATLVVSVAGLAFYGAELVLGGPSWPEVPALERVASLLILAWMLAESRNRSLIPPRATGGRDR